MTRLIEDAVLFMFVEEIVRNDVDITRAAEVAGAPRVTLWRRAYQCMPNLDFDLYCSFLEKMDAHRYCGRRKKVT